MFLSRQEKEPLITLFLIFILIFSSFTLLADVSQSATGTELHVEFNSPNEGDIWTGGGEQNISWTLNTSLELSEIEVVLEYVSEGEGPYLIDRYEKGDLTNYSTNHTWTVPEIDSDEVYIIIRAEGGGYRRWKMVSIEIDSTVPEFLFSSPSEGGLLLSDSNIEMTFSEEIDLDDLRSNFTVYGPSSTVDGTIFGRTVDDNFTVEFDPVEELEPSPDYYIEISGSVNDNSYPGNSLEIDLTVNFTVKRGPPLVEVWTSVEDEIRIGNTTEIGWSVDQDELINEPINISYTVDGGNTWINIASGLENEGSYIWEVPKEPVVDYPVSNVLVNVSCENEYGFIGYGYSQSFTVYENLKPVVEIERPYEDLVLVEGQETEIRWKANDDVQLPENPITISISTNGGNSWRVISYDVENDGLYQWKIDTSAENAVINVSCTDSDDSTTWSHSDVFTILEKNPLELSLDPDKEKYHTREQINIGWVSPPMVDDYQHMRVSFSDDGESWSVMNEVEPGENTASIRFPFAMSSQCRIMLEVVDDSGTIYSVVSEEFEVFPEVKEVTWSELGDSTMIHISFGSYVSRGLIESCLYLYKDGEKIEVSRNEVLAMSGSDIVLIKDGLPEGNYNIELNSSSSNVEFDERIIYQFEIGEREERGYVTYWPTLLLIPLIAFLLYTYKIKLNSSTSKSKQRSWK
ncbi:MAG: Ig-like domain-containing protein [Thermoplasmatota archaeon]